MKIVHLNTSDIIGGAARAAYRLHSGLRDLGCDSQMLVLKRQSHDASVKCLTPSMNLSSRLRRFICAKRIAGSFARYRKSRPSGYELFSDDRTPYQCDLSSQLCSYDVINLHWIAGFVDYQTFFLSVPQRLPVVWTLHDMNAFTGGCHYDLGCEQYTKQCGACPQLGSANQNDLSRRIWKRKQRIFRHIEPERLNIVALNRWMAKEISQNELLRAFSVTIIPNGVDTETFAPHDRGESRRALGIPQEAQVILFIADSPTIRRKGFAFLRQALAGVEDQINNVFLLSAGEGKPAFEAEIPHMHLDKIADDHLLSKVYSAADIFVIPSLQDNLPNTVLEALACGTPVVGFAIGGIPEMVRCSITGLLAKAEDVAALREAIVELLRDPIKRAKMAANCRRLVLAEYTLALQAKRYLDFYEQTNSRFVKCPGPIFS